MIMAIRGTAAEITEKWASRTSGATQQVIAGVNRVTEAPGVKAGRQQSAYVAGVTAKQDKWKRNVESVTLPEWQAATAQGATRIAAGVAAKKGKMESFLNDFIPHLESVQRRVQAIPRGDMEQNITRMVENVRGIAQFQRGRR